ncbi:retrovirus-related pol polyprotein from transposon TNT 1-94 [Tanacetum coccineum]
MNVMEYIHILVPKWICGGEGGDRELVMVGEFIGELLGEREEVKEVEDGFVSKKGEKERKDRLDEKRVECVSLYSGRFSQAGIEKEAILTLGVAILSSSRNRQSLNVRSKSNSNNSLPRTLFRWLPKMQPLAEPVAKWILKVKYCLDFFWIIDSGCSKHMTGNRALLTNYVEKFLGTVRFGNNDFAMIAGYGDVVIGSMMIKKVYYVEAKASSLQSWLWHQRLSHLNFTIINNLVKNNLVRGLPKMKFKKYHLCSACEQGKIHQKHHKSKTTSASNKRLYLLHMDLCGPMHVESINRKRYVLVVIDDYSRYTWVFFLHSKDEASEVIISFIKKTQANLQLQVQCVRTDNGIEFKNKTLAKFFDEVGITQQFFAVRTP